MEDASQPRQTKKKEKPPKLRRKPRSAGPPAPQPPPTLESTPGANASKPSSWGRSESIPEPGKCLAPRERGVHQHNIVLRSGDPTARSDSGFVWRLCVAIQKLLSAEPKFSHRPRSTSSLVLEEAEPSADAADSPTLHGMGDGHGVDDGPCTPTCTQHQKHSRFPVRSRESGAQHAEADSRFQLRGVISAVPHYYWPLSGGQRRP